MSNFAKLNPPASQSELDAFMAATARALTRPDSDGRGFEMTGDDLRRLVAYRRAVAAGHFTDELAAPKPTSLVDMIHQARERGMRV